MNTKQLPQFIWDNCNPQERLAKADQVKPLQQITPAEAQKIANFVVFNPTSLPDGFKIESNTFRPEQPPGRPDGIEAAEFGQTPWSEGNPCSLRTVISDGSRKLRIKQFLYDWAPNSASIAALWDSQFVQSFEEHGAVGWIGTDYRDEFGATIQLRQTTIELSTVAGKFTAGELKQVVQGLTVADEEFASHVVQTPFHKLNYWVRYQLDPPKVPHGLWKSCIRRKYSGSTLCPAQIPTDAGIEILKPGPEFGLILNSVVKIQDTKHQEVETIYHDSQNPNHLFWFSAVNRDSANNESFPLQGHEFRPCWMRGRQKLRDRTVWIGGLNEGFGAWEAFWDENGVRHSLWTSALSSKGLDPSSFWSLDRICQLVESMSH